MAEMVIEVKNRTEFGKNANRRLRVEGFIPGVVYGQGKESIPIAVDPKSIKEVLHSETGENTICRLQLVEGEQVFKLHMILRDYQRDPVTDRLLHVDFLRLDMNKTMEVKIPVELEGVSPGVKENGGILDCIYRELKVECLPDDIPDKIVLDISALEIGDSIRVKDVQLEEKVTMLENEDQAVVVIHQPRAVVEETEEEGLEGEEGAEAETEETEGGDPAAAKKDKAAGDGGAGEAK